MTPLGWPGCATHPDGVWVMGFYGVQATLAAHFINIVSLLARRSAIKVEYSKKR
jgi:hypothetical protein